MKNNLRKQKNYCTFAAAYKKARGVAQSGSASGLGPGGRRFESFHPDIKGKRATRCAARLITLYIVPRDFEYYLTSCPVTV